MNGHDYVKIQITITYIPEGKFWQSGLLTKTHNLILPIETIDVDLIAQFIKTNIQEITNVVQTES